MLVGSSDDQDRSKFPTKSLDDGKGRGVGFASSGWERGATGWFGQGVQRPTSELAQWGDSRIGGVDKRGEGRCESARLSSVTGIRRHEDYQTEFLAASGKFVLARMELLVVYGKTTPPLNEPTQRHCFPHQLLGPGWGPALGIVSIFSISSPLIAFCPFFELELSSARPTQHTPAESMV